MAKSAKTLKLFAWLTTVAALLLGGAAFAWWYSAANTLPAEDFKDLPRFSQYTDTRLNENRTIEVRAEVQGKRTGGYTFSLHVLNFGNEVTYVNTQSVNIGAYPYVFTHRIDAALLGALMRKQYNIDENTPFCEPVRLLLTLIADEVSRDDYYEYVEWRANVDACTVGDTYIPPQDAEPAEVVE